MRTILILACIFLLTLSGCLNNNAELSHWPEGKKSAFSITFDVEQSQKADILKLREILLERGTPATFFVVAGYYEGLDDIYDALNGFEVSSKGWNQSEWSQDYESQRNSIKISQTEITSHGYEVKGFRAPYLSGNRETLQVLGDLDYIYDSSSSGGALHTKNGIVVLPLSVAYDPFWSEQVEDYLSLFYLAFERTYDEGGLFVFYTLPEHVDERFVTFLDYISTKDIWLASNREIAEWWLKREAIEFSIQGNSAIIKNRGESKISGLTLKTDKGLIKVKDLEPDESVKIDY